MANLKNAAPHLLKSQTLPGLDEEAKIKHLPDSNTPIHEAPADESTNGGKDKVSETNSPAGERDLLSRFVLTSHSRMSWQYRC
jgi:hypothetical protein